jgi:hypothetical protein
LKGHYFSIFDYKKSQIGFIGTKKNALPDVCGYWCKNWSYYVLGLALFLCLVLTLLARRCSKYCKEDEDEIIYVTETDEDSH